MVGFKILGLDHSPIRGPEGNIEYLLHIEKSEGESVLVDINQAVDRAHEEL